jgi:hypothetical protein
LSPAALGVVVYAERRTLLAAPPPSSRVRDLANTVADLPGITIVGGVWVVIMLCLIFPDDEED